MPLLISYEAFRRCFYSISRETFTQVRSEAGQRGRRLAFYRDVALLIYASRVFFIMWAWGRNFTGLPFNLDLRLYDPVANYLAVHSASFPPFTCALIYLFAVFDFTCQAAFYALDSRAVTWRWWYQLVVENLDKFERSRFSQLELMATQYATRRNLEKSLATHSKGWKYIPRFLKESLLTLLAKGTVYYQLGHVNKKRLLAEPLSDVLPGVSPALRLSCLRFLLFVDQLFVLPQILLILFFASFYLSIRLSYDISVHPWGSLLCFHAEFTIAYLALNRMCRSAYFFVVCTLLGTLVYTGHLLEVGAPVRQLSRKKQCISPRECHLLHRHLTEHNLVCYLVLSGSRTLFGNVLLAFLLCHLPVNVYLLARNVFIEQQLLNQLLFWVIVLCQTGAGAIVFLPLAYCSEIYHSPARYIPALQTFLPGSAWARVYKLKYDSLYGRLVSGKPKMAVSIGSLTPITYMTTVEFIFIYLGYTLKAFETVLTH